MSLPKPLISAATLGTDQSILETAPLVVRSVVSKDSIPSPQARLLAIAAGLCLRERAGWVPSTDAGPLPEPCEPDTRLPCSPRALRHLTDMLKGRHRELLPEWLYRVEQTGQRIPEEAIPLLMNAGKTLMNRGLRDKIIPILGKRGVWLNEQCGDMGWGVFRPEDIDHIWRRGTDKERVELIQYLRGTDPDKARELVSAAWEEENSVNRHRFLKAFAEGLSMDDEPLLEATFDDGSPHLRETARDLLTQLPESRFRQRMLARAVHILDLVDHDGMMMVELIPPAEIDDDLRREGVASKNMTAWDVACKIIEHVSPRFWSEWWGLSAEEVILAVANNHDWDRKLFSELTIAAYNNHDTMYAEQLFAYVYPILGEKDRRSLVATLSPQKIEMEAIHLLQTHAEGFHNGHPAMPLLFKDRISLRVRRQLLVSSSREPLYQTWSVALTRAFLASLQRYFANEEVRIFGLDNTRSMLQQVALKIPIGLRKAYLNVLSVEVRPRNAYREIVKTVRILLDNRADMIEAINERAVSSSGAKNEPASG